MEQNKIIELLSAGINELELNLSNAQIQKLYQYLLLLNKWNKVYSLSAITKLEDMVIYHVLDGLSAAKYFANVNSILDIGSGMGVPGVVLAIIYPECLVTLIDSNAKKASFLRQVAIELKLSNVSVINKRVEDIVGLGTYDIITSRAFASMSLFYKLAMPLLSKSGKLLAYKSTNTPQELLELASINFKLIELVVPKLPAVRFLVRYDNETSSN